MVNVSVFLSRITHAMKTLNLRLRFTCTFAFFHFLCVPASLRTGLLASSCGTTSSGEKIESRVALESRKELHYITLPRMKAWKRRGISARTFTFFLHAAGSWLLSPCFSFWSVLCPVEPSRLWFFGIPHESLNKEKITTTDRAAWNREWKGSGMQCR